MSELSQEEILEGSYPLIEWRKPVEVVRSSDGVRRLGCRFCIALYGLKGRDIDKLFVDVGDWRRHMAQFHAVPVNDK